MLTEVWIPQDFELNLNECLLPWKEVFYSCADDALERDFDDLLELCLVKVDKYLAEGCISSKFEARLEYYHKVVTVIVPIYKYLEENKNADLASYFRQLLYLHIIPRLAYDFNRTVELDRYSRAE